MSLSKLDLSSLFEVLEVPADERVIVGIDIGGDEGSTPVNLMRHTHCSELRSSDFSNRPLIPLNPACSCRSRDTVEYQIHLEE